LPFAENRKLYTKKKKENKEKDGSAQKIGRLFGSLAIQIMKIQKTKLY